MRITERPHPLILRALAPVGLQGRVHVAKLGRDGKRIPVRVDRNKRAFQRVWDHVQGNLITDSGLNHGLSGAESGTAGESVLRFNQLTTWVHVGTDNTTPDTSDSALGAEVGRTSATLSLGTNAEVTLPSTGVGQFRRVRAFDYEEANGNLTEFGGGAADTTTVLTRALFVDESDSPTPITKTSDELLVITYDLLANVSPISMTSAGTVTITGYDTFDISSMAHESMAGQASSEWLGLWNSELRIKPVTAVNAAYQSVGGTGAVGAGAGLGAAEAYVSASYERSVTAAYGPQVSDASLAGYELGTEYGVLGYRPFFTFRFDSPATLEKDKDYRVTLSAKITVARS